MMKNILRFFEEKGLANAVFQVIAADDIITLDGTVRANSDDVVAELVTDENGYAETDLLYLGKYEIKEVQAPFGYVKNPEIQAIELTYAGQEMTIVYVNRGQFINELKRGKNEGIKVNDHDEQLENVFFGLFNTDCTEFTAENAVMTAKSDKQENSSLQKCLTVSILSVKSQPRRLRYHNGY